MKIKDGHFIRRLPNGQFETREYHNMGPALRVKEEIRKGTRRNVGQTGTKSGSMRVIGSMPKVLRREMDEVCKGDPDKEKSFMRDHPEHLLVTPRQAGLPARKVHVFPSSMKPRRRR